LAANHQLYGRTGELVAIRQRMRYSHAETLVEFTGMGFFRCRDGKIIEAWWNIDAPGTLQQPDSIHLD